MTDTTASGNIFTITAKLKLAQVAAETGDVLKQILERMPAWKEDFDSAVLYDYHDVAPLDPKACPGFEYPRDRPKSQRKPGTRIIVFKDVSYLKSCCIQIDCNAFRRTPSRRRSPSVDAEVRSLLSESRLKAMQTFI